MANKNQSILSIYSEKLNTIQTNFRTKNLKTSFGNTPVIIFGDDKKQPLFLVHGLNSAAPFAFDLIDFLTEKYQIFAIDVLGQPNKSDFIRLDKKTDDYGKWLLEIIHHFKKENVTLCGFSFGTFPILQSLLIDDKKVMEVFLISPASIVTGNLFKTIFRFLLPMKKFRKTKQEVYLKKCMSNLYNDYDELTYKFQKEIFLNFDMDFTITPNFSPFDLQKIKTPISIIASKDDFFVPALKLKKRSKKNITSLKNFMVFENEKHVLSKEKLKEAFQEIMNN